MTNSKFSESDLLYFREVRNRLLANEPIQYILGTSHFYGIDLISDKRGLIPRPETEELVDWIVNSHEKPSRIADICSGSGCIALALKKAFPNSNVLALEISDEALELIAENSNRTRLEIEYVKGDALDVSDTVQLIEKVDILVSNPPYVLESDKGQMQPNVLEFEPHLALFVPDNDPLLFYRSIAQIAQAALNVGGALYFEIHENYADHVIELMELHGFVNIELRKDLQGKPRMLKCVK
jgi:release factor glutamine methyltransferase